ncbi:MAG: hypothetical protein AAGC74_14270 [Verrucomicrobiota bacterium]
MLESEHEQALLTRWLARQHTPSLPRYSIAIQNPCPACQKSVAQPLAHYLNEFCDLFDFDWLPITPSSSQTLFDRCPNLPFLPQSPQPWQTVASLGGTILEFPHAHPQTASLPFVFQVILACKPPEPNSFHLHLNQKRFDPSKVVPILAESFLEWAHGGGDPANSAQAPATRAQTPPNPIDYGFPRN